MGVLVQRFPEVLLLKRGRGVLHLVQSPAHGVDDLGGGVAGDAVADDDEDAPVPAFHIDVQCPCRGPPPPLIVRTGGHDVGQQLSFADRRHVAAGVLLVPTNVHAVTPTEVQLMGRRVEVVAEGAVVEPVLMLAQLAEAQHQRIQVPEPAEHGIPKLPPGGVGFLALVGRLL